MAGEVYFHHPLARKCIQVGLGGVSEIVRTDVHIVHVEQQAAAGAAREFLEEINLVPGMAVDFQVVRRVFDSDALLQRVLRPGHIVGNSRERLAGARKRQQVGVVGAAPGGPGEMLGDQCGPDAPREPGQPCEVLRIRFGIGSERLGDTVQRDCVFRADCLQPCEARAAGDHVILGMHLEPQPFRRAGKRRIVVLRLQAEPGGESCGHGYEVFTEGALSS